VELHSIHPVPDFADRQYTMHPRCGQGRGRLIEHMFDIGRSRVSNVCSGGSGRASATWEAKKMELALKVILVGYVLYAVLGAPMVSAAPHRRA
jgi:hypothetical protein